MIEIHTKEAIDRLTEYFCQCSDKETLARACASHMMDLIRFLNIKSLPEKERKCLINRTRKNYQAVINFILMPKEKWEPLRVTKTNSEDENWREVLKEHDAT